ncbi:hypothetical protein MMC31_005358, partial [Peltigera leucophlebia]|nr:hypothetical protein [Peltigera leucophlebia]
MTPNNINKNQDRLVETYDSSSGWLLRDTTQEITSFDAGRLDIGSETVVSNTDAELLCTYNWISSKPSAIFVPGAPPAWSPKKLPITLPMDPGLFCPQQAAYKPPEYPYEPLYQALSIMNPEIDFNATHLVTNRRCLQMLFNFASGITFQDFRIDLHMVHKTLFLTRRTKKRYLVAHADGTTKIGSNFESAFTKSESGLEDSSSHHRVVGYSLGDLKCVVRFEADACYEKENEGPQVMDKRRVDFFSSLSGEELRAKCEQVSSSAEPKIAAAAAAADVSPHTSVVLGGRIVPSSSMAELKTYQGSHFYMDKHLPQLWFGRTSNLLVGNHIN